MQLASILIFLGACVGHIAILTFTNNWWFAHALPHRFLACLRITIGFLILGGLFAFVKAYWFRFPGEEPLFTYDRWTSTAEAYAIGCAAVGLILVPFFLLSRKLRGQPAILISNHTRTLDIVHELGYKPLGRNKYRTLARIPGNQVFQVDMSEKTIRLPRLPRAWDGLSILHLSDLHFCGTPDKIYYQRVMDLCQLWEPDIVAFTGDLVDTDIHYRWILPILGKIRWKVAGLAILGNHDSWHDPVAVRRRLARVGYQVVSNSWKEIQIRGEPMTVVGHEGPWFKPAPDLTDCPAGPFRLCLSHTPDNIRWAQKNNIDLMLAGHTHGGQIRFPLLGSLLVPSKYGRRYDCGTFHEPPTVLHVSRGLGGEHPLRFNCRPEVTKLVLRLAQP